MMLLRASIIALITIGVTKSQDLNPHESPDSVGDTDFEYRPWIHNDVSTTWISLDGMGINTLNSMFRLNIPDLRWLVMDNNRIQSIPSDAFKFFPNLTYISLVGNQISQFEPDAFNYLEKLRVLDLDRNPISNDMDNGIFGTLPELRRLYFRNCMLRSFELPTHADNLSHFYLSNNQLEMFYVSNESTLTYLHLDNNQLRYVSLSQLKSLVYLNVDSNQLTSIVRRSEIPPAYYAKSFGRRDYYSRHSYQNLYNDGLIDNPGLYLDDASVLQHLVVSSNQLSKIDPDTFLDTEALTYVDLTHNEISEVYAGTFNNLLRLENILLDWNKIEQINHRAFVNLPNLKTISLKNNQIDEVDEDAFTKLNSSANEVYLFLDNNRIHTLRRGSFRGIKGLKHIGLSNNRIKTISSQAFVDLPNLDSIIIEDQSHDQSLDRSNDRWDDRVIIIRKPLIESDAFFNLSSLTSIIIRRNLFTDIAARAFHELPKLKLLDLSKNSIKTLSSEAFCDLPALETLYLGGNLISKIEPETFPEQLKHLDLSSNLVSSDFNDWHVGRLRQLEILDIAGIIERFKIEDLEKLPKNLTVIVEKPKATSNI